MRIRQIPDTAAQAVKATQTPHKRVDPQAQANTIEERKLTIDRLFDSSHNGMLQGFNIDPADQPKGMQHMQSRITKPVSGKIAPAPNTKLSSKDKTNEWVRQEFPSLGVPYGTDALFVRPIILRELASVHAAQETGRKGNGSQAFTQMLDALAGTLQDFDIRDLTVPDYYSHLYWLRLNSYPRSPFTVPWRSRFGNEQTTPVSASNFDFTELEMTRAEYLVWQTRGISFPTVRDMEVMFDDTLSDEQRWMMNYAQYMYIEGEPTPDLMQRKLDAFEAMGTDAISYVNEFASKAKHGVSQYVKLRDSMFNLDSAIAYVKDEVESYASMMDAVASANAENDNADGVESIVGQMYGLRSYINTRVAELEALMAVKENGGLGEDGRWYQPEMEVVTLDAPDVTLLFP